ncbi:amidohydrolase 2 [Aspergillus germanicus]
MADNPHLSKGMRTPTWTPRMTLSFMASNGIETSILSCAFPLAVLAPETPTKAATLTREVNDYLASLPSLEDTETCIEEIRYSLDDLHADGVLLFTSYNSKYLGLPDFKSVWAELNARGAVVFTHPTIEGVAENCIHEPFIIPPPLLDWTHETSSAAMHLILTNTPRRFPDCRIILSHGGGTLPFIAGRMADLQTRISGRPEEEFLEDARRLYFDIALVGPPVTPLQLVLEFAESGHVLFGTDFPFVAAEGAARRWEGVTVDGGGNLVMETRNAAQVLFPRLRG